MSIDFHGRLVDQPRIRAGFIGCGSHSFRNIYPTFQFAPVELAATCDLDRNKAAAFAAAFGARASYVDHREMLAKEHLDAVFIVTGYDKRGRPTYPGLAVDCLEAGCHVFTEKPPAASCAEIEQMRAAGQRADRQVLVGLKKMFFPANEKARELMSTEDFGACSQVLLRYPTYVPTAEEFSAWLGGEPNATVGFLDHLCHPASLMLLLLGMPSSLYYERSASGGGVALFTFPSGAIASIAFTHGASLNGGMEHTTIVGTANRHITVDNNHRVTYHRVPGLGYGDNPDFYRGTPEQASAVWEPEFSLGQLYNKGLFLLGYYNEVREFARAVLEHRPVAKGTLDNAWQATRVFEAFAEGPGRAVRL